MSDEESGAGSLGSLEELEESEPEQAEEEEPEDEEPVIEKVVPQEKYHGPPPKDHERPVKLTKEQAGDCLTDLGKTYKRGRYAYRKIDAQSKNLTNISIIPSFEHVMFVDVSDNRLIIEDLECLEKMRHLFSIVANKNRIISAQLPTMKFLQELCLNENYIQSTENITQPILECLSLNHNQIKEIGSLSSSNLPCLSHLELRGNSLRNINGIDFTELRQLYLADNLIDSLEGIEKLVNLRTLHLRENRISRLDGFTSDMKELRYLNLRKCEITDLQELAKIACLPILEKLKVMENPFTNDAEEDYRAEVLAILPKLTMIDKSPVLGGELADAKERKDLEEDDNEEQEEEEGGDE